MLLLCFCCWGEVGKKEEGACCSWRQGGAAGGPAARIADPRARAPGSTRGRVRMGRGAFERRQPTFVAAMRLWGVRCEGEEEEKK